MTDPADPTDIPDPPLDRELNALFDAVRPGPALEDNVIASLRTVTVRRPLALGWAPRIAAGLAASVGVGLTGFGAAHLAERGGLPMPGAGPHSVCSFAEGEKSEDLTNPDVGLAPELPSAVEVENLRDVDVMATIIPDQPRVEGIAPPPMPDPSHPVRAGSDGISAKFAPATGQPDTRSMFGLDASGPKSGTDALRYAVAPPADSETTLNFRGTMPGKDVNGTAPNHYFFDFATPEKARRLTETEDVTRAVPLPALQQKPADAPANAPQLGLIVADPAIAPVAAEPVAAARKVIRSGDIEFEIDSFDPSVATVTKLVAAITGAFVGTVNSDKLPNGKVKGSMVVRVPPDHLDSLVLDLRKELGKAGELKGQRIGSQDVTKQYTDTESRLRAARTMETRLLQIIKEGKGEIKQLLEAEKELGNWRTKIEEYEGELRYYANQVSLSTLTVTLTERDIKAAAGLTETERVQAGIEVEDVDTAFRQATAAVAEAKGRVTRSELKQHAAGQFVAVLHFEVSPDAAGPLRDRLKQLGHVARLEVDRTQTPEGGTVSKDAKLTRGDTVFQVQFYNLANIAPRETAVLRVAVPDVPTAYQSLRDAVAKANGRVLTAQLNEQDRQNVSAQFDFDVRRPDEPAVQSALAAAGDTLARTVGRAPEGSSVTDSKVLYRVTLVAGDKLKPRETTTLSVEVADVDATTAVFAAQATEAKGRVVDSQVSRDRSGRVTAKVSYEVPLPAAGGVVERFKAAGVVRAQQSARDPQATDGRFATARIDVTVASAERLVAKDEGLTLQIRKGLAVSASVLLASVTWVVVGLCVVLPWALVGYGAYRVIRPRRTPAPPTVS